MKKKVYILIPPSEGKNGGGDHPPLKKTTGPREVMIKKLLSFRGDWGKMLGVKGKALQEAVAMNQNILKSPTIPAIQRYSGVVYKAIDYDSMTKISQHFFDQHVRIVSAVFGLLTPQDLIPNYKLKIDKLEADRFWSEHLARELKDTFVIDLLPQAHKKAAAYSSGISVDFFHIKNGQKSPAGHHGKTIKGQFIRWLCENKITSEKDIPSFMLDGYRWTKGAFYKKIS